MLGNHVISRYYVDDMEAEWIVQFVRRVGSGYITEDLDIQVDYVISSCPQAGVEVASMKRFVERYSCAAVAPLESLKTLLRLAH